MSAENIEARIEDYVCAAADCRREAAETLSNAEWCEMRAADLRSLLAELEEA